MALLYIPISSPEAVEVRQHCIRAAGRPRVFRVPMHVPIYASTSYLGPRSTARANTSGEFRSTLRPYIGQASCLVKPTIFKSR